MATDHKTAGGRRCKRNGKPFAYQRTADQLRRDIAAGRFASGQLPPERLLHRQLGVSLITIKRAMDELVRDGLIYRRRGHGTFIKDWHLNPTPLLRRTNTICYVSGAGSERTPGSFFNRLLLACQEEAQRRGFNLLLANAGEGKLPPALQQRRADAVVLAGTFRPASAFGACPPRIDELNMRFLRLLAKTRVPVVSVSNHGSWPSVHRVLPDYGKAMRRVLSGLRERGHERIGLWGGPFAWPAFGARRDAFLAAAEDAGMRVGPGDIVDFPRFTYLDMPGTTQALAAWLRAHPRHRAALLVSGAPVLATHAAAAAGRAVPATFEFVALADNPPREAGTRQDLAPDEEVPAHINALVVPMRQLAAAAVQRVVELLSGQIYTAARRTLLVDIPFVPGPAWTRGAVRPQTVAG